MEGEEIIRREYHIAIFERFLCSRLWLLWCLSHHRTSSGIVIRTGPGVGIVNYGTLTSTNKLHTYGRDRHLEVLPIYR